MTSIRKFDLLDYTSRLIHTNLSNSSYSPQKCMTSFMNDPLSKKYRPYIPKTIPKNILFVKNALFMFSLYNLPSNVCLPPFLSPFVVIVASAVKKLNNRNSDACWARKKERKTGNIRKLIRYENFPLLFSVVITLFPLVQLKAYWA